MPRVRPGNEGTRAIHNGFITEAVDWGVQGFTLMLLFLWAVWRIAWKGRRLAINANDKSGVLVFACIAAGLTAWIVSSLFGDYLNDEWGFWVAAMAYSYYRVHSLEAVSGSALANDQQANRLQSMSSLRPQQVTS